MLIFLNLNLESEDNIWFWKLSKMWLFAILAPTQRTLRPVEQWRSPEVEQDCQWRISWLVQTKVHYKRKWNSILKFFIVIQLMCSFRYLQAIIMVFVRKYVYYVYFVLFIVYNHGIYVCLWLLQASLNWFISNIYISPENLAK